MAPTGWVDVHGHFFMPMTDEEWDKLAEGFHSLDFMLSPGWRWSIDDSLAYMDRASIQMQMLSFVPHDHAKLRKANDYGAAVVRKHPTRFGQLAAIPTDDTAAALAEIERAVAELHPDGFAVNTTYRGVTLSDPCNEPVWKKLNDLKATLHVHPDATAKPRDGRPSPLIEVAFETCRVAVDLLYRGVFRRYPDVKVILAHCGGALPALSGRLALLGTEEWTPNPEGITKEEIKETLSKLYVDTAASGETGMQPAVKMVGEGHVLYGADCGVPCSTEQTMEGNRLSIITVAQELGLDAVGIGQNAWALFPSAAARVSSA